MMLGFKKNEMATPNWKQITTPSGLGLLICCCLLLNGCLNFGSDSGTITVISEQPSPDGKFTATSFYCEGGGAAGYCFSNVSLRRAKESLSQRDGLLGKHKTWNSFSDIEIRWIDNHNLEVAYKNETSPDYRENNSVRVASKHGVNIHYIVKN